MNINNDLAFALAFIAYSIFELWIGKTDKTKANSSLEFIGLVIKNLIIKMKGKPNV